jgi:uncharacterized phiE125 gp8 family phage protein
MWYPATVITPASNDPVSLAQAKTQCRITAGDTSFDDQLNLLISAARAHVENYCCIRLVTQTIRMKSDGFCEFSRLPDAPIQSVVSVKYLDTSGTETTLAGANYELRNEGLAPSISCAFNTQWPTIQMGSRVTVEAIAGYSAVPSDIVSAILLIVSKSFSFSRSDMLKRSETVEGIGSTTWGGVVEMTAAVTGAVQTLLEPYRCWPLA